MNTRDCFGWTPLQTAAMMGLENVIVELIQVDGSENAKYVTEDGPIDLQATVFDPVCEEMMTAEHLADSRRHVGAAAYIRGTLNCSEIINYIGALTERWWLM